MSEIKEKVLSFLTSELAIHNAKDVTETTSLIKGGYIDSITTLQLVDFLEKTFDIEFEAHDVDRDNLDTLDLIEATVLSKSPNAEIR